MNLLTRLFALHFDRSFSGKGWRQLAWLFGVIYGAQNETYIEGWEKKTSKLLIYKRLCKI